MKQLLLALCCLWPWMAINVFAGSNPTQFELILAADRMSGKEGVGVIMTIAEDPLGFMWFGGENGLARFDGHDWRIYRANESVDSGLPGNQITDLITDASGVLWVSTDHGLVSYNANRNRFEKLHLQNRQHQPVIEKVVTALATDRFNNLLVGTRNGFVIVDANRQNSELYTYAENNTGLTENVVKEILVDSRNRIWIATESAGLNLFDRATQTFIHFQEGLKPDRALVGNQIRSLMEDDRGRIWAGTYGKGITILNEHGRVSQNVSMSTESNHTLQGEIIWDMLHDSDNKLWLATEHGGLGFYDVVSGGFVYLDSQDKGIQGLLSNTIKSLYEDSRGDVWISTFPYGLSLYNREQSVFQNYVATQSVQTSLTDNGVLSVTAKDSRYLWVGTENGLNLYDSLRKQFTPLPLQADLAVDIANDTVIDLNVDKEGHLWLATWGEGLKHISDSGELIKHYNADAGLPSNYLWQVLEDTRGRVWVGTDNSGVLQLNKKSGQFERIYSQLEPGVKDPHLDSIRALIEDSQGDIWIGTFRGVAKYDSEKNHFDYDFIEAKNAELSVFTMKEDKDGRFWVGTMRSGLLVFSRAGKVIARLDKRKGLPSNKITSINFDLNQLAWVSTTHGIARIDPNAFQVTKYTKNDGLVSNHFNRDASYVDHKGYLYFGSSDGLSVWHPSQFLQNVEPQRVRVVDVAALNDEGSFSSLPNLFASDHVIVPAGKKMFKVQFSLFDFKSADYINYAYRLLGYSDQWIYPGNGHQAFFTDLPAGLYTFQVKSTDARGQWSNNFSETHITVKPTVWRTWWAMCLYVLCAMMLMILFWWFVIQQAMLKKDQEMEDKLRKLDRIKNAVLANTSHELRSPLNRIIGLSETMVGGGLGNVSGIILEYLRVIILNARQLVGVVDDILEYSSLNGNIIAINKELLELRPLVNKVLAIFVDQATNQKVKFVNAIESGKNYVFADEERLNQILKSILSTSLKFTSDGSIEVSVIEDEDSIEIHIIDTGLLIPADQIESIFLPFNLGLSLDAAEEAVPALGLAVTKHMVELHGGHFDIQRAEDDGNHYIVSLPTHDKARSTGAAAKRPLLNVVEMPVADDELNLEHLTSLIGNPDQYTVMVVDDDPVTRMLISKALTDFKFNVVECEAGEIAISHVNRDKRVDLVILDVVMPGMSGYDVCQAIRAVKGFSVLPVIFISAKRSYDDILKGVLTGANDFLIKPVSKQELIPRIINQLRKH